MTSSPGTKQYGAVILARLDSRRLAGKALREVNGHSLLWYVISRCRQAARLAGRIVVATSDRMADDPIARYCQAEQIPVFRGSVEDVSGRALRCASSNQWDYFFRVNGDSPFLEPALLDQAIEISGSDEFDIITNLYPRSYPYGVSVELLNTAAFAAVYPKMHKPEHFEHVTRYIYENMAGFRYYNLLREGEDLSKLHLTIDTDDDFKIFCEFILQHQQNWLELGYEQIAAFYRKSAF